MAVVSESDSNKDTNGTFTFDTAVNTRGGELSILFKIVFSNDMKLNADAPQRWHVTLPVSTWTTNSSTGKLSTPVSVKLPEDEAHKQLRVTLNIIACTAEMCVPLKLSVVYNVHRSVDAPTVVTEEKELVVTQGL